MGHYIVVDGEAIKVGILCKESANARIFRSGDSTEIKGIFALVQWYRRGKPLEKIAYDVVSTSVEAAEKEMVGWIPKLQYPAHKETSRLIKIIEHGK